MLCHACGKENPKKETVYSEDKKAYCINPFTCNDEHPNSAKQIIERGTVVQLFNDKELDQHQTELLDLSDDEKRKIHRIVTKPMTVRINQVPLAYYLLQVQEEYGLGSLSEAIRFCVEKMSELVPSGTPLYSESREETEPVVEEKPKQEPFIVNQPPKEETPQEPEDDMTF